MRAILRFIQNNLLIFSLLFVYILFCPFFEAKISSWLVEPFFSQLKPSCLSDIVTLIIFVALLVHFGIILKNKRFISNKILLITVISLTLIAYYRYYNSSLIPWSFTSMALFKSLKYIDVVFITGLLSLLVITINRIRLYCSELEVDKSKGFRFDNPIKYQSEDELNRNNIAESIVKRIKNTKNKDASFAIGIVSDWGRGKTSFLNLIEDCLTDSKDEKKSFFSLIKKHLTNSRQVVVHYNPWFNNDEQSVISSFFDELSSNLKKYDAGLSAELKEYSDMLTTVSPNGFSKAVSTIFNKQKKLRERYEDINTAIRRSNLHIVVIIDDLDRLHENEIIEVLKLIRNSANFSNTIFLVAYDKSCLISAIEKINNYQPDVYLEKIFQLEVALPAFESDVIAERLKELLHPLLLPEDQTKLEDLFVTMNDNKDPLFNYNNLTNFREVNHFINSFVVAYDILKGEVELCDLMNLELLKTKYLGVYNLLVKNHNKFLKTILNNKNKSILIIKPKEHSNDLVLKEYLEIHYKELGIQQNQLNTILSYIEVLFPPLTSFSEAKRTLTSINNPISMPRYFHNNLLNGNLSAIEFSKYRQKTEPEFLAQIEEWVKEGYERDLHRMLGNVKHYGGKEDYKKIINAIFHFQPLRKENFSRLISRFDESGLLAKLMHDHVVSFIPDKNEFKSLIKDIFDHQLASKNDCFPVFLSSLFRPNVYFVFEKHELIKLNDEYLKKYVSENVIDNPAFYLYQSSRFIVENDIFVQKESPPQEIKELFKRKMSENPDVGLSLLIGIARPASSRRQNNENSIRTQYQFLAYYFNIWGSQEAFEEFLNELSPEDVSGLEEYRDFYQRSKETNFQSYIDFDFKEFKISMNNPY